jgi:hypothetical protein
MKWLRKALVYIATALVLCFGMYFSLQYVLMD